MDIDNPYMNVMTALTVPDIDDVTVVDYDALEERIYWADVKTQTIKRAFINGTQLETIISAGRPQQKRSRIAQKKLPLKIRLHTFVHGKTSSVLAAVPILFGRDGCGSALCSSLTDIVNCRGLALDWLSRNLYWLSSENDESQINVARFDGSLKTSIIHGIDKPRCLVVHPAKG